MTTSPTKTGYVLVNGLEIYHEIHGTGQPLILLHGAFSAIGTSFGKLIPTLAAERQVIGVELQGHGRTADIDRPLRYELMADDVAAFITQLGLENADIFGYSMGAGVALQTALRHPTVVRKLVLASVTYHSDGYHLGILDGIQYMTAEAFAGSPPQLEYADLAPNPQDWATLIDKVKDLDGLPQDWSPDAIRAVTSPTLLIVGDSDVIRPEHSVELFRLLGGGVAGDMVGLPASQLAILPGTTHVAMMDRADLLLPMVLPFLDAPMPTGS